MKNTLLFPLALASSACLMLAEDKPPPTATTRHGIQLCGKWTVQQLNYLDKVVDILPADVVASVPSICVQDLVKRGADGGDYPAEALSGRTDKQGNIFLRTDSVQASLLHEMGHSYTVRLVKAGEALAMTWKLIAGSEYESSHWRYPNRGILTGYGATNYAEDIAEWVRVLYTDDPAVKKALQNPRLKSDPRFRAKLDVLNDYGFLTSAVYQSWKAALDNNTRNNTNSWSRSTCRFPRTADFRLDLRGNRGDNIAHGR